MNAAAAPITKISPSADGKQVQTVANLPNEQLLAIADFLPKTSRALFAVALTASPESWCATGWRGKPSEASKAIISSKKPSMQVSHDGFVEFDDCFVEICFDSVSAYHAHMQNLEYYEAHWDVLFFSDIEESLIQKLTDNDIGCILVCINAKESLKKIRLCNNENLVGHGLEPLRGSAKLEEIDLGFQMTTLSPESVIPILDSIIDAEGNSLRKFRLPNNWETGQARNETPLRQFFAKFNQLMLSKDVKCCECSKLCRSNAEHSSCQVCFKRICAGCNEMSGDDDGDELFPRDELLSRYERRRSFIRSCDHCSQILDDVDAAAYCEFDHCSNAPFCLACRDPEEQADCWGCRSMIYPKLTKQNVELTQENK
ncbi:hypothetical protein ACHAXR_002672 [Thalassiosira sp. AJA248-18]